MAKKNDQRDMADDIIGLIREGTKKWTKTRKAEERSPASRSYRYARMTRERGVSFKEAAAEIMEEAYMKVSGNGAVAGQRPADHVRRAPHIQKVTGKQLDGRIISRRHCCPTIMKETGVDWDVVYDARGHFNEPHGGEQLRHRHPGGARLSRGLPRSRTRRCRASAKRRSRPAARAAISARCCSSKRKASIRC